MRNNQSTKIINGDLLKADADVIIHQVNCQGRMGSGVARQIRKKYPNVFSEYRKICRETKDKESLLGQVLCVNTPDGKVIANMFAQLNYGYDGGLYTDYTAFYKCLESINAKFEGKKVALPYKIGCDRGGADWNIVSHMIEGRLNKCDVALYKLTRLG